METMRVCLAALMLVSATYCSQLLDQYEDGTGPVGHAEATDRAAKNLLQTVDKHGVPELQVGCADGLFHERKIARSKKIRKRAVEDIKRRRRGYYEWPGGVVQAPASQSFTVWQPPVYQISRPYFIPVWGGPGRLPVYYPPQPILINKPPYPGQAYLPPKDYIPPTTTMGYEDETTINLGNRIKPDEDNEDDAPVWDVVPARPGQQNPIRTTTPSSIPTRRTSRPGQRTTFPPLVHRNDSGSSFNGNSLRPQSPNAPNEILGQRPQYPGQTFPNQHLAPPVLSQQPAQIPTTTQSPARAELSRCVWAIISCCSVSTMDVSYSCFEQLGCTGAFWDSSPCSGEFARAAIAAASNYYNGKK